MLKEIDVTIASAQSDLMKAREEDKFWNFPLYLGPMYSSQYFLLRHWLELSYVNNSLEIHNLPPTRFDQEAFRKYLIKTQKTDGSWQVIEDLNNPAGNLNASIMNYAALKAMGTSVNDNILKKAKTYILSQGGIAKSMLFTKIVLALFNNPNPHLIASY
jgi:squalene-hopene/tetraprenyl-beta-curcumene cyclase